MSTAHDPHHGPWTVEHVLALGEDPVTVAAEAVVLVVEIVSPSANGRRVDRLLKPPFYAEGGIGHLWRLELEPSPVLVVGELEAGGYAERIVARAGGATLVEKPFPVEVDPGALVGPRG